LGAFELQNLMTKIAETDLEKAKDGGEGMEAPNVVFDGSECICASVFFDVGFGFGFGHSD